MHKGIHTMSRSAACMSADVCMCVCVGFRVCAFA